MAHISIKIRKETIDDYKAVEHITREAFWNLFVPGCDEHYLCHILRDSTCFIPELDYVAEADGRIVGNIIYSKAKVIGDNGEEHLVIMFGPIAVLPEYQHLGIGSKLIEHTKQKARQLGYTAILIYGDPKYYEKVGFVPAENYDIATADNKYHEALQAYELIDGALQSVRGRFVENKIFDINMEAAMEFDKGFEPKKHIKGLPSQIRFQEVNAMIKSRK